MSRRDDPEDPDGPRGLIQALLALLEEMEERGERTRSGHGRVGRTSFDYSVDIGGLSEADEWGPFGRKTDDPGQSSPDATVHVTTRETSEGLVLAADLPGVEAEDVDTWIDRESEVLVVEVEGDEAARLPLDDVGWTVTGSRFANGVLEVELHRD